MGNGLAKAWWWIATPLLALIGLALIAHGQQVLPPVGPPQAIACAFNTSPPTVASGNAIWVQCDTNGKLITSGSAAVPLPLPTAGITPYISPSVESCHVMKASQATAVSYGVTTGATAGYLMVFNATSAPADGAVTPVALAIQVPANATVTRTYSPPSTLQLSTGFTVCFSSTGPFTKTASATAMLEGTWQ